MIPVVKKAFRILAFFLISFSSLQPSYALTVYPVATNAAAVNMTTALATSGSNFVAAIVSGTNECFQMISTNGSLIGSLTTVGNGTSFPLVAYAGGNYMEYWDNNFITVGGVYGQIISANGNPIGSPFAVGLSGAPSGGIGLPRALASDGTNFLAAWFNNNTLYGQFYTSSGAQSGAAFTIANNQTNKEAALAFGKTNYLFVWQTQKDPATTYGTLISPNGTVGTPFQISQTNSPSHNPLAVAFDGTNFFVIWNRDLNAVGGVTEPNWNLDARFVSQNGTLIGNQFTLFNTQTLLPGIAFDGTNYLVCAAFDLDSTNADKNMLFRFFDRTGQPAGPAFAPFPTLSGTNTPLFGGVVWGASKFCLGATIGNVTNTPTGSIAGVNSGASYAAFIPSSFAPPTLSSSNRTGSQFPLVLTGTPGINYSIQTTTNLASPNWIAITTNSPTNGVFSVSDGHATNDSRFYSAIKQ